MKSSFRRAPFHGADINTTPKPVAAGFGNFEKGWIMDAWQKFLDEVVPGTDAQEAIRSLSAAKVTLEGKTCTYRPLYSDEMKTGTITGYRERVSLTGEVLRVVTLDNGAEKPITEIYFFKDQKEILEPKEFTGSDVINARSFPGEPSAMRESPYFRKVLTVTCPTCQAELWAFKPGKRIPNAFGVLSGDSQLVLCPTCERYISFVLDIKVVRLDSRRDSVGTT